MDSNNKTQPGRNCPCLCGSGKKHKHCFLKDDSGCVLRKNKIRINRLRTHDEREKLVLQFFDEVLRESTILLLKHEKGHDQIPLRIQMIVCFSLIDMMANYWYEYRGVTGRTNDRPKAWYESYCANGRNPEYKDMWLNVDTDSLYEFRNSLVHFFGLGRKLDDGTSFSLAPNDVTDEVHSNLTSKFLQHGESILMIRPERFYNLIRQGALLMLEDWRSIIIEAQSNRTREGEHIDGIERVWMKIETEGASRVERAEITSILD